MATYSGIQKIKIGDNIFNLYDSGNSGGTITSVKTTAGAHTAINVTSGAANFNVPTATSHLTNDSGFITGSYLPLAGGTMTGQIQKASTGVSWVNGRSGALIRNTATTYTANNYNPIVSVKSINGTWDIGTYTTSNGLYFTYITDTNFNAGTNTATQQMYITGSGGCLNIPRLRISATNDVGGTAAPGETAPFTIGGLSGEHIEIDTNEILAKSNGTTPATLYLQDGTGTVSVSGSGGLTVTAAKIVSGGMTITSSLSNAAPSGEYAGQTKCEANFTLNSQVPSFNKFIFNSDARIKGDLTVDDGISVSDDIYVSPGSITATAITCWNRVHAAYTSDGSYGLWIGRGQSAGSWTANRGLYDVKTGTWMLYLTDSDVFRVPQIGVKTSTSSANVRTSESGYLYRYTSSSEKYKTNIIDITNAEALYDLPVHEFKYKEDYISEEDTRYDNYIPGFIAEEVEQIYPIAVDYKEHEVLDEYTTNEDIEEMEYEVGEPEDWNVRYIVPPMLKLIQDQKKEINELKTEINELKQLLLPKEEDENID